MFVFNERATERCDRLDQFSEYSHLPVSVIFVTFNSSHCISSALDTVRDARERIVVDNASSDGSADAAKPLATTVICNDGNLGFGAACNLAARIAREEFLLFMNPDVLLKSGGLRALLNTARAHPSGAAIGARSHLPDWEKVPPLFHGEWHRAKRRSERHAALEKTGIKEPQTVETLFGSLLLCRRDTFLAVGGFDTSFFLYFEDEDLCRRLKTFGPLMLDEGVQYTHLPGSGCNLSVGQKFQKYRHYGQSRVRFSERYEADFKPKKEAFAQAAKGVVAALRADLSASAQHFGRAIGYVETVCRQEHRDRLSRLRRIEFPTHSNLRDGQDEATGHDVIQHVEGHHINQVSI